MESDTNHPAAILEAALAVMGATPFCFLITLDASGQPQARLMEPFPPGPDLTVWMGTNPKTRKIQALRRDERATLAYTDGKGDGYLTLVGRARLVDDPGEKSKHWKPTWKDFYENDAAGSDYVLIEFTPARIEIISVTYNLGMDPLAFEPAVLVRSGSEWVLGKP
jgi:general stress protein 26